MTANERDQDEQAGPEFGAESEDDGWISLSEEPFTRFRSEDEGRDRGAEGRTAPPPPPGASPPSPEDGGWVSVAPGTVLPPRPARAGNAHPVRVENAQLALQFIGLNGQLFLSRGQTVRLGRSNWATPEAAEILADESTVSGRHASVEYAEDGTVWLTEVTEGSTNGTRVNQHQVLTPGAGLRIRTGDTVWLGPHINFLVRGGGPRPGPDDTGQPPGV
ncbi:FHA domain-containing protein [Streptomyces sp. NBC_01460]|uniref:FHA domain-containing protein n=1 Tax=Streptomyces sp. NBC_01460 TaxID=2903875 RepID=UPI002E2FDEEF|nr:FHA domain-containing protein [Streptomyces sp. NBC_01460]